MARPFSFGEAAPSHRFLHLPTGTVDRNLLMFTISMRVSHRHLGGWQAYRSLILLCFTTLSTCVAPGKTFILPHVLEKSGTISNTQHTFDTTLFITYNASLIGKDTGSATVELYLYDSATGELMRSQGGDVCGPCTYQLNGHERKVSLRLDDLIAAKGGFDQPVKTGFGVVVVSGAAEDAVNLQVITVNSHTNENDVAVFGFEPRQMSAVRDPGTPQTKKTFVLPHILESSGKITDTQFTFDTTLFATYTAGLAGVPPGSGATVDLYLYDQTTGQPMIGGGGTTVCNPCSFALGAGADGTVVRKQSIVLDDLVMAAGGFGGQKSKPGFGVIVVGGADPEGVSLQGFVVNAHTGPFDLSAFAFEPEQLTGSGLNRKRTFVLPHVLESSGTISQPYSLDTSVVATYTSGLGGTPEGLGSTVELYLYDNSGVPMVGLKGTPVCNPCVVDLGAQGAQRKQVLRVDDYIVAAGGFDTQVKLGFGIIVVGGADPDGVTLQGFVVNSHTSPFDLSVFGFNPQEVQSTRSSSGTTPPEDGLPAKVFVLPHVLEKQGTINEPLNLDDTLIATYTGGLPGIASGNGAVLKLYLYDSETSLPLAGATGTVCNPCSFDLSASSRKLSIRVEDLILTRGGGFDATAEKNAFGVLVLDGDTANVNLQNFVVNSHTGPFDLSVFGFDPQPIQAARVRPMPVTLSPSSAGLELSIPTVIGGKYSVEAQSNMGDPTWLPVRDLDGDGTVQVVPIPAVATQQFLRVKGM